MGRCDLVVKHRGGAGAYRTDGDTARHRRSLVDLRRGGKPVLHNEFFLFARGSTADPSFVRKMLWADFTGGGHANLYDFTWWRGTGANVGEGTPSRPPPAVVRDAVRSLRRFVEEAELPFWRMEQRDELASRAGDVARAGADGPAPFVLARPGEAYAVYLVAGGTFRLDLSAQPGSLTARWFDPRAGSFEVPFKLEGGRTAELKAPGEDDWALHVAKGGAKP
ncbi:MAG: hypothetical protein HY721_09945 [Planctomycetes bacterium]|nr:hypothetical protein [Planctomycetota bacterium]